jgi:hypothetical protein
MNVPKEWLTEQVDSAPTSYHRTRSPITALRIRAAWQKLKLQANEGDEVWAFSSPPKAMKKQARYSGYALVRNGRILQSTVVNSD